MTRLILLIVLIPLFGGGGSFYGGGRYRTGGLGIVRMDLGRVRGSQWMLYHPPSSPGPAAAPAYPWRAALSGLAA